MELFDNARKLLEMEECDPRYEISKCAILKRLVNFKSDNEEELKTAVSLQIALDDRTTVKEPPVNVKAALVAFKQVYVKSSVVKTLLGSTSLDAIIEARKACVNFIEFANKSCQIGWHDKHNETCAKYANYLLGVFYSKYKKKEPFWNDYYYFRNYCIQTYLKGLLDISKVNNLEKVLEVFDGVAVKLQEGCKDLEALNMFEEDKTKFLINENEVEWEISRYLFKGEDELREKCYALSDEFFKDYQDNKLSSESYDSINSSITSALEYYLNPKPSLEVLPIDKYYRVTCKILRPYDMTLYSKDEMMKAFVFAKSFLNILTKDEVVKTVISNIGFALIEVKDKYPTAIKETKKLLITDAKKLFNNGYLNLEQYYDLERRIENS